MKRWVQQLGLGCVLLVPAFVRAAEGVSQEEVRPLKGPVQIRSDQLTVQQKERLAVFSGNVVAVQDDLTIRCEQLTVTYAAENDPKAKSGEIVRMLFSGSVFIGQKRREGHCDKAEFDRVAGRITCTGNPWVVEGENRIEGEQIEYLLDEDEVHVTRPKAILIVPVEKRRQTGRQP